MAARKRGGCAAKRTGRVVPQGERASTDGMCSPLRHARIAANLTQEGLANLAGLAQESVSKTERRIGDYGNLGLATARALAAALGTTVDALFPPKGGAE